jgi:hypothetical protein
MDEEAKQAIEQLRVDLYGRPSPSLIYAAKYIQNWAQVVEVELPDFVQILANGNPEAWKAVMETATADAIHERNLGGEHDSNE